MESPTDRPPASDAEKTESPSRDGKVHRVAAHMQGLFDDLRTWIDLRIDLAILRVEERIDKLQNDIALGITLAIFGFFAALFSLATLALGVGWILGHPFWGFLAVSVALILIVAILQLIQPSLVSSSNLSRRLQGEQDDDADQRETSSGPSSTPDESTNAASVSSQPPSG